MPDGRIQKGLRVCIKLVRKFKASSTICPAVRFSAPVIHFPFGDICRCSSVLFGKMPICQFLHFACTVVEH